MITNKKIEFLINQGFERNIVETLVNCGVGKYLFWFLGMYKKGFIKNINEEETKLINFYFEKCKDKNLENLKYSDVLNNASHFEKNEKRKLNNRIYHFDNGFHISILNPIDLEEESNAMSNCISTYWEKVSLGEIGILALKTPKGKTVVHFEIKKNGLIGQNFSKANSELKKEYWKMILEFFENNNKAVDLSKVFGEFYIVSNRGGYIENVSLSIPTSIKTTLKDGIKEIDQIEGFEVKRFSAFQRSKEEVVKTDLKSDVVNLIEQKKQEMLKFYDDLIENVLSTSSNNLYLSDEIKEKIFGNENNSYTMKGFNYNLSELNPYYEIANVNILDLYKQKPNIIQEVYDGGNPIDESVTNIDFIIKETDKEITELLERFNNRLVEKNEELVIEEQFLNDDIPNELINIPLNVEEFTDIQFPPEPFEELLRKSYRK